MIRNPYAKKRPRPSGWISSSSSSVSAEAPVEQRQLAPSGVKDGNGASFGFGSEDRHHYKENSTNQISDSYNQNRPPTKFEPSEHLTSGNSKNGPCNYTNTKVTTSMVSSTTSHSSQKTQTNPHTEDSAKFVNRSDAGLPAKRTLASTTNYPARKVVYNPYARNKSVEARVSVPSKKSFTPHESVHHHPQSKAQANSYARQPVGTMNGRTAHEKQSSEASMPRASNSNPPRINAARPLSKVSSSVGSAAAGKSISCKPSAKLPPSMASIRPSSWKSSSDSLDKGSQPLVPSSTSASTSRQPISGAQSFNGSTCRDSSQLKFGKTDDDDRLPPELSYKPDEVKPIQDEYRMQLIKNANLSSPLKNGWTLFPHQKKAIIRALTMRRMILALDMGLGKTLIGSVWSKAFKDTFGENKLKVFVVCPVSLKEEWQRTAEGAVGLDVDGEGKGKSKAKGKKSTKKGKNSGGRSRPELSRETGENPGTNMKMSICSWAKVPKLVESGVDHFVVCCDEAHAMQSTQAQRTKDILSLVNDKR